MHRLLLTGLVGLLVAAACASSKMYTLQELPDEQLWFRSGGGFTGETREYLLLENGQVFFRREVINPLPLREHTPLDAKAAAELFQTYDKQDFGQLGYDDPGNMTYVLTRVSGPDTARITWGGAEVQPTEELRTFWRRAIGLLGETEPKPVAE